MRLKWPVCDGWWRWRLTVAAGDDEQGLPVCGCHSNWTIGGEREREGKTTI